MKGGLPFPLPCRASVICISEFFAGFPFELFYDSEDIDLELSHRIPADRIFSGLEDRQTLRYETRPLPNVHKVTLRIYFDCN
jgi:hypothetical protein